MKLNMWYIVQIMFVLLSGLLRTLTYEILDFITSGTLRKNLVCNLKYFSVLRKVHDYLWPTSYSYGKMNLVILTSPLHQEVINYNTSFHLNIVCLYLV